MFVILYSHGPKPQISFYMHIICIYFNYNANEADYA